jgi:hypothetical protein
MIRAWFGVLIGGLLLTPAAPAQTAGWQFHWQQGQILTYRVEHLTAAASTADGKTNESRSKLNLTKSWQVLDVDAAGIATVQLVLKTFRMEMISPSGGVLLFDSTDPAKSDPDLSKELAPLVGPPLSLLRVDGYGRVIEVKECKFGPASRLEAQPPFEFVLPTAAPKVGEAWERGYKITLEPPSGAGEKYDAVQTYTCKAIEEGKATLTLATTLKTLPESPLDRVPLLDQQPEGQIVFDTQAGRLHKANLHVTKEILGHQGEGSSYKFQSTYTVEYVDSK